MNLNHLNLCVSDLSQAISLFQSLFDFKLVDQKGDAIAVMTDSKGFTLVLSKLPSDLSADAGPPYPKDFHLGFYMDTRDEVDRFHQKLEAYGITSEHKPRLMRGGYTLYFTALDGVLFEVSSFAA